MAVKVGNMLLPGVLVPWAATSILPLLAAGSLPSYSLISCNTTCIADTGHFGIKLGPVPYLSCQGPGAFSA